MEKQHLAQNSSVDKLSIILNNSPIENVHSHKILGIEVDEDLDFTNHCEILDRKISKRILSGLLKHISHILRETKEVLIYGHQHQEEIKTASLSYRKEQQESSWTPNPAPVLFHCSTH